MDPDEVDAALARHLNVMSLQERTELFEEIHGVLKPIEETPSFIHQKLHLLEVELNKIPDGKKHGYNVASKVNREYVYDQKFKLMFLRVDRFDEKKAAIRLVTFLDRKLECFGISLLTRRVFFSDLDIGAQSMLRSGAMQVLPSRDRSGRVVIGHFKSLIPRSPSQEIINSAIQATMFFLLTVAEDEENQKNGVVSLGYYVGSKESDYNFAAFRKFRPFLVCEPIRLCALHICTDSPVKQLLIASFLGILSCDNQVKRRLHFGDHTEVQYSLLAFGIDVTAFPISYNGALKLTNHEKWIARRQDEEYSFRNHRILRGIELPKRDDVLLGRGRLHFQHHGNARVRELVETNLPAYVEAKVGMKRSIAATVVDTVKRSSGRFLERDKDGWWIEVPVEQARKKISKAFVSTGRTMTKHADQKRPATRPTLTGEDENGNDDADATTATSANTEFSDQLGLVQPYPRGKRSRLADPYETEDNRIGTESACFQIQDRHQSSSSSAAAASVISSSSSCVPKGFCPPRDDKK